MMCFSMICVSGQSKSRPVKAAGAEVGAQRRHQKLHAAVAKSTFTSQNAQNTTFSELFLKFWCRKIARRCGEKHIHQWKCTKHVSSEALFDVLMSQNCTPLWREAYYEVKMLENWRSGRTFWSFDVAKLHAAVARSILWSQNAKKLRVWEHFLKFWCRKIARGCTKHVSSGQFFEVLMSKN